MKNSNTILRPDQRDDIIMYIYDEYKSVHGIRPRWMRFDEMSDQEILNAADQLDNEIRQALSDEEQTEQYIVLAMYHPRGYVSVDNWTIEMIQDGVMTEQEGSITSLIKNKMFEHINAFIMPEFIPSKLGELL